MMERVLKGTREDAERVFAKKYLEVIENIVKHRVEAARLTGMEIHHIAVAVARYHTYVTTGHNIMEVRFGGSGDRYYDMRIGLFLNEAKRQGTVTPRLRQLVSKISTTVSSAPDMMHSYSMAANIKTLLRQVPSEVLKREIINTGQQPVDKEISYLSKKLFGWKGDPRFASLEIGKMPDVNMAELRKLESRTFKSSKARQKFESLLGQVFVMAENQRKSEQKLIKPQGRNPREFPPKTEKEIIDQMVRSFERHDPPDNPFRYENMGSELAEWRKTGYMDAEHQHEWIREILNRYSSDAYDSEPLVRDGIVIRDRMSGVAISHYKPPSGVLQGSVPFFTAEEKFFQAIQQSQLFMDPAYFHGVFENIQGPDDFRARVLTAKEIADRYIINTKKDRLELRAIRDILSEARRNGSMLYQISQSAKYADTDVSKFLRENVLKKNQKAPEHVLQAMSLFVRQKLFNPLPLTGTEHRKIGTFSQAINRFLYQMDIADDMEMARQAEYLKPLAVYRNFRKGYYEMIDALYGTLRETSIDAKTWMDFWRGEILTKEGYKKVPNTDGLLDRHELESLYKFTHLDPGNRDLVDRIAASFEEREVAESAHLMIQRRIAGDFTTVDDAASGRMASALIDTIRRHQHTLETADNYSAFVDQLYEHLPKGRQDAFAGLTKDGLRAMLASYNLEEKFAKKETRAEAIHALPAEIESRRKSGAYTTYTANTTVSDSNLPMWREAQYNKWEVTLPNTYGRHTIESIDGGIVKLRVRGAMADQVRVSLPEDIDFEKLKQMILAYNERMADRELGKQFDFTPVERKLENSVVEVRYKIDWVNEDLAETDQQLYDRLRKIEDALRREAPHLDEIQTTQIRLSNLLEPYHKFMTRSDEVNRENVSVVARSFMPNKLYKYIRDTMPYMIEEAQGDKLASQIYMALVESVRGIGHGATIDLTDEGFIKRWQDMRMTQEQIDENLKYLRPLGLRDRLDEFMLDIFQRKMKEQYFNKYGSTRAQRDGAVRAVLKDVFYKLSEMYENTRDKRFEPTPANIEGYLRTARQHLRLFPFYEEATRLSEEQIKDIMLSREWESVRPASLEDYMVKSLDDYEDEFRAHGVVSLDTNREIVTVDDLNTIDEFMRERKRVAVSVENQRNPLDILEQHFKTASRALSDLEMTGMNMLEFMYDFVQADDPTVKYIPGKVFIDNEWKEAEITRGTRGDIIAVLQDTNEIVPILRSEADAIRYRRADQYEPQRAFGKQMVEQTHASGGVRRVALGDYQNIQRKGAGYLTQADPSDTFDLVKDVLAGKRRGVYLDMETTGLADSTIPSHLIQPLEIFMRRAEWNPEAGDWYRVNGEIGYRVMDDVTTDALHMIITPTREVREYAQQIMDNPNFYFTMVENVTGADGVVRQVQKQYNVMDVLRMRADDKNWRRYSDFMKRVMMQENGVELAGQIARMVDELYFLRNIAKYSGNEVTFAQHIGRLDSEMDPAHFERYFTELKADVAAALRNFEENPETGNIRLLDVMKRMDPNVDLDNVMVFSGDDPSSWTWAFEQWRDFVRNDVIIGQNVSEADIAKSYEMLNRAMSGYGDEILKHADAIADILENQRQELVSEWAPLFTNNEFILGTEPAVVEYYRNKPGIIPTSQRVFIDGEKVAGEPIPTKIREQVPEVEVEYLRQSGQLQQLIDQGDIIETRRGYTPDEIVANAIESFRPHYEEREQLRMRGEEVRDTTVMGRSIDDLIRNYDRLTTQIGNLRTGGINPHEVIEIANAVGYDLGDVQLQFTQAAKLLESAQAQLPDVIEEMFVAGFLHPELRSRRAEKLIEAAGLPEAQGLHLASTDVDTHLEVLRVFFNRLNENPEFQNYQPYNLLRTGDIVLHDIGLHKNLPLGAYRVESVGPNFINLTAYNFTAPDGKPFEFQVRAENPLDLNRKFLTHFQFLGEGSNPSDQGHIQNTIREFEMDLARRYMQRASRSAFNFDLQAMELGLLEQGLTAPDQHPLAVAEARRRAMTGIESAVDQVLVDNTALFGRPDFDNLRTLDITPSKRAAFNQIRDFFDSEEGRARQSFLHDVRALQRTGVITESSARELIRQMNASIIEEGRRRGRKLSVRGIVSAGVAPVTFGDMAGENIILDMRSPAQLRRSLFSIAQDLMPEAEGIFDAPYMTESNLKSTAMNELLFPFLRERGLIEYEDDITLAEAMRQLQSRPVIPMSDEGQPLGVLQQVEEFDWFGYRQNDPEFVGFIRQKHEELLGEIKDGMTEMQRMRFDAYHDTVRALQEAGMYDPNLKITPVIDASQLDIKTLSFNNYSGLRQLRVDQLLDLLPRFNKDINEQEMMRRSIFQELFRRATEGKPNSIEGLLFENAIEPDRIAAAEALGWIERIPEEQLTRVRERLGRFDTLLGAVDRVDSEYGEWDPTKYRREIMEGLSDIELATGYRQSRDFANMYLGVYSDYSHWRLKDVPQAEIAKLLRRDYTEYSGASLVAGFLQQWADEGFQGQSPMATKPLQRRVIDPRRATVEDLEKAGMSKSEAVSHLRDMVRATYEASEEAKREAWMKAPVVYETMEDTMGRLRPDDEITNAINRGKERVRQTIDRITEGIDMDRVGRAAKWVAGIGIAAFALRQFANASGPLKFDHRPQGHGVEGIASTDLNDDIREPGLQAGNNPSASSKAYVTAGQGRGYTIRARARDKRNIDHNEITSQLESEMGAVNINVRDDRQAMDRRWLEQQFDTYIQRGHLG